MGRSSCSALLPLLALLILPAAAGELDASANGESRLLFIEAGDEVIFSALAPAGASVEWDFGRDVTGPGSRWNSSHEVGFVIHAAGAYNVTCIATLSDGSVERQQLWVVASWEEPLPEPDTHRPLFIALAGSELFMGGWLLLITWRLREEKSYL
ncbi:MAG: hypothetical protein BEU05_02870 [Marine Group III euryarchaeote CG-Bathy2]|uniref:PKD domain-containing protein n=2 Tax=Methanobacteriati TaxID=3366610 RepID=A0A075GXC8_9EURY|nr:hypothetical protein [uncultured marine group II/III euryarchaeote KM3_205_C10]OIR12592.1 MAG: hypothetical protein BEU05_02870 [Marine Group III euryarchaeote CG-Bathy2]